MEWNWEQANWPEFSYKSEALALLEQQFLRQSGEFVGACKHIGPDDQETLKIELISEEAVKTSEIEGEILNRDSVQSSLRHQLGLGAEKPGIDPAERGISEMMADLYRNFARPLDDATMFAWHKMLLAGDKTINVIGGYRIHEDPMQVVSGPDYKRTVHFEAPPSSRMTGEMSRFITWFNDTAPGGKTPMPALTRAGIAHLYFVCIHPFEDGNGRVGRALAEKSLAQNLNQPSLIALAYTIERKRKHYYASLERNNKDMEITPWLTYFANTILEASVTRSAAWISSSPKQNSTKPFVVNSMSVRTRSSPACSRKASTDSREVCQRKTTSPSAEPHAPPPHAICKT